MKTNSITLAIAVLGLMWKSQVKAGDLNWHAEGDRRWAALEFPKEGKTGFTLMPSEHTGLNFTNSLDEWSSAANRVLENGSGVAVGDFDRDGKPDIFVCSLKGQNALYRNLGAWRFEDVTLSAGVNATNYVCRGAVFADINGDGWLDLLISTLGHGVLCFLNDGKGEFVNASRSTGTESKFGSTTLALADIDGNGTLDLYVANYRTDDIRDRSRIPIMRVNGQVVLAPELRDRLILANEGVVEYGEPDILYLNDGKGHFTAVSWTGGAFLDENGKPLAAQPLDWGLAATFRDLNGDGSPDLYVCNDYWTPDRIWINDGKGKFQAIARLAIRHTCENSMGVDFADIDRDGHLDFLVLDMLSRDPGLRRRQALAQTPMSAAIGEVNNRPQIMRNTLFHNRGDGTFEEIADFAGVFATEWSWQPVFMDVDLDGYEDLIIPAGHRRDVQDLDATLEIKSRQHQWPKDIDPKAHQEAFTREMMEHAKLYPPLMAPIVAFRNLGNLKFEDMTQRWGTGELGVHQGVAFADFDGDGDLDFVVNNLNGACEIYRNESIAPRVAVRLKGLSPNTQGIGAKITLRDGAVPLQSQEIICGGRYLSGDDPMRVFAAGSSTKPMRIEVKWRSGKRSVVNSVTANRIYEIDESGAAPDTPTLQSQSVGTSALQSSNAPPVFEDVSSLIDHRHHEVVFNDFERQPLLPRKLSQLGPGVGWFDLDGDGHEDLIIGSGKGGVMAVYHNDGRGGFARQSGFPQPLTRDQTAVLAWTRAPGQTAILSGLANYEDGLALGASVRQFELGSQKIDDGLAAQPSSTGPLALADIDGDGDLDLFVGGRVIAGRYPEPADSRLFRNEGGRLVLDEANTKALAKVGLVSGAVWSDLDSDGFPELVLACEWGPVRIFHNDRGRLIDRTRELGLSEFTGWWTGVTAADLDEDGRLDIIVGNWGLNSPDRASREQPVRLLWGDLRGTGTDDLIETEYNSALRDIAPRGNLSDFRQHLPFITERFSTHLAFSKAMLSEVLGDFGRKVSEVRATTLTSMVFFNRGNHFEPIQLPREAQFAPAFAVVAADFDGDGHEDIFLSQNFFANRPELPRQDAGRGLLLRGDGTGKFMALSGEESGIKVYGEQRGAAACDYDEDGRPDLVITQNGAQTKLYRNVSARPGLRVRLQGPPTNPSGIGVVMRMQYGDRKRPAREVHAGSGYWSQDSAVQVLGLPESASRLDIRWPGGKSTSVNVPAGAREILVSETGEVRTTR